MLSMESRAGKDAAMAVEKLEEHICHPTSCSSGVPSFSFRANMTAGRITPR